MWKTLLVVALFLAAGSANECVPRSFGVDRIVCVCNATYCDGLPDNALDVPKDGSANWYVTNKEGLRLSKSNVKFGRCQKSLFSVALTVDAKKQYQKILGFGGAFTDSAGINIKKLSTAAQDQLIRTYYDPKTGSKYALGRIPIGGTDFSTRPYTYDDVNNDTTLEHFALAKEDYSYKIPFAKQALELNPNVKFFSAAWSAPAWMKTNDEINGFGFLKMEYYQLYAEYLMKFLEDYKKNGLDIWAFTTGNEPFDAYVPFDRLNTMGWTPPTMAKWVADNMGPTLAASKFNETLILALDDQRFNLPWYMEQVFANKKAKHYISGTAVHWYGDVIAPPSVLDRTHNGYPDKFILMTEACEGTELLEPKVILGSWSRGEKYVLSIIEYLNHWAVGWVDWNIALDKQGGPNWIENYVDSPIIVNPETDEFYKQPMYYALTHFSRFVPTGSIRISITDNNFVKSVAFLTPTNEIVIVLYNRNIIAQRVNVLDPQRGTICLELSPNSINTVKYKQ